MPAGRDAREPVPGAARRIWKARFWVPGISLVAKSRGDSSRTERIGRYRRGRLSELVAAAVLMAKGYRILGRRVRTPHGEIDLVAVRGKRLAFVEVKRRATREECEAALTPAQAERIARAAEHWTARRDRYRDHDVGLDAVLVVPGRLPAHVPDALNWHRRA
jgi:putative endonuclease